MLKKHDLYECIIHRNIHEINYHCVFLLHMSQHIPLNHTFNIARQLCRKLLMDHNTEFARSKHGATATKLLIFKLESVNIVKP